MACGSNSDETEIVKVLKEMSVENQMTHKGVLPRNPSSAAKPLGSDFRKEKYAKKKAVMDSFGQPKAINLKERLRPRNASNKPLDDKQDKGGQTTQSNPQKEGKKIHRKFADQIRNKDRDGITGEMLDEIGRQFRCNFIQAAEVNISGYAVTEKAHVDFWSGKMDAVAFRRSGEGVLQVFVVEWKTTAKDNSSHLDPEWWTKAGEFKKPLYQCLVYRELLQAHLKRSKLKANVGIILVPIHQNDPEFSIPGLCVDFKTMDEMHLLDKLKDFQWLPILDESVFVYTVKLPCKLFKESFDPAVVVDETTNILKGDTRLKDIFNDNATVADLRQVLDLPCLKVEGIKEEETKAQKDDKTSAIEIAAATDDKTNEEPEEVNKKEKASSGAANSSINGLQSSSSLISEVSRRCRRVFRPSFRQLDLSRIRLSVFLSTRPPTRPPARPPAGSSFQQPTSTRRNRNNSEGNKQSEK